MNVELISHASILVSEGGEQIIIDPWLGGSAFNDSWNLSSKVKILFLTKPPFH